MPTVTLDACILYRGLLTDLLLWVAHQGAFVPSWSEAIHGEWSRNLASRLPWDKIEYRLSEMRRAFPAADVPACPALLADIQAMCRTAAQRGDAHVVATAATAGVIVTDNLRDFDDGVLRHFNLAKQGPDTFLLGLLGSSRRLVLAGMRAHRASLKRTSPTPGQYLRELAGPRADVPGFCKAVEAHKARI